MSNVLKLSGALKVGNLASAPSNPQEGFIYFDTTSQVFRLYQGGQFRDIDATELEAHLNGTGIKHGADEVSYDRADIDKKNINAASDDVESALSNLDDAVGALDATPTNYTPTDASIVADHLAAIDATLGAVNVTPEFADDEFRIQDNVDPTKEIAFEASSIATATTRTITMPDANVNLGDIATNAQAISDAQADIDDLVTLSGVAANSTDLGTFTGSTIPDNSDTKEALQALETEVELKLDASEKGAANGVAELDSNGKVPLSQLPNSIMEYKGTWNASTNTPTLADGGSNPNTAIGDVYRVTVAGTQNLGSGNINFDVGDYAILNDAKVWEKAQTSEIVGGVSSVNGEVADVVLDSSDIDHTQANTSHWTVADGSSIAAHLDEAGERLTDTEASLTNKLENVVEDTTPELGGNLDANGFAIEDDSAELLLAGQNSVRRAKQASKSNFVEEEYLHSISLSASQTNTVISALTFAFATYEALEITYKIKESTTNNVRVGTIRVVTNGTSVVLNDMFTDSAETNFSFSAAINGSNVEIRYSSATNGGTMRADIKRFLN